jgi:hypothetical protein
VLGRSPALSAERRTAVIQAVEEAFGWNGVDYAMLVKLWGLGRETDRGYSPPVCNGAVGPTVRRFSTSCVERQNLTMRMQMRRVTRLTNAFSNKAENHAHAVALHFVPHPSCRPHQTLTRCAKGYLSDRRNGCWTH